jgi:hypothetical protein
MSAPSPVPPARSRSRRGPSKLTLFFWLVVVPAALAAAYFFVVLKWNYSSGERAGWVQKFSKKGWLCKTWEGEMAMVTMPGSTPEKFMFTVWDDNVAERINRVMGKRVTLHYDEKIGLPTSCFGETRHFVTGVAAVDEIPLAPGIVVPVPGRTQPTPAAPVESRPPPSPPSEYTLPAPVESMQKPAAPESPPAGK